MKTERLKCPSCDKHYPIGRLFCQSGWRMRCPSCSTRLAFSQRSAQRAGAIGGLTLGFIIVFRGSDSLLKWPTIGWFMLFAFVYGRILSLFLGSLERAPNKISLDPFPNQTRVWKTLSVGSLVAMFILGLSGFFWKHLPLWAILSLSGLMVPLCIILLVTTVHNFWGKNGILRKEEKSEPGYCR